MTFYDLLTQHPDLAKRHFEEWEIDGPCANEDGSQVFSVRLSGMTSEPETGE